MYAIKIITFAIYYFCCSIRARISSVTWKIGPDVWPISWPKFLAPHLTPMFGSNWFPNLRDMKIGKTWGAKVHFKQINLSMKVNKLIYFPNQGIFWPLLWPSFSLLCLALNPDFSRTKILAPHLTLMFGPFSCHGDSCQNNYLQNSFFISKSRA